ncbi:MAG: hypothetical protein JWO36_889 [Myxococcales bacterium]|nr:hypothetical protein [Myxococcales bacterium]
MQGAAPKTEAEREAERHALAAAIVPQGSTCLPLALKEDNAPRLELAAVGADAVLCAVDVDRQRLLGPVGCWKIDLAGSTLAYQEPAPLPGHNLDVMLDDRCARGFCLPKEAKAPAAKIAHMAWNLDGTKVAVLIGDDVHLFDGASKAHESAFNVRGEKGVTNDPVAVNFIGDMVFVEGSDQGPYSAVWGYKTDGTPIGPLTNIGGGKEEKPISTYHGSFSILDKTRVGVSERGMETLNMYEIDSGKRAKLVRKVPKPVCKPDEVDAYWHDGDKVTDKCKEAMDKSYGYLMGATAVMGSKSLLVVLRGDRVGELGVLDAKTLAEKKSIKLPWCEAGAKPEPQSDKSEKTAPKKGKAETKGDE